MTTDPDRDPMPSIDEALREAIRDLDVEMRHRWPVRYWLSRVGDRLAGRLRRD